jgi:hypothetical protein
MHMFSAGESVPAFRKGARGPTMLHMFCLYQQFYYLSVVQIDPFRPSQSHSATDSQSFRFSVKISSRSALAGVGPEPAFGGAACVPISYFVFFSSCAVFNPRAMP